MRYATTFLLSLSLLGVSTVPASAQSTVDPTSIEAELRAIAATPTAEESDRGEVRSFLESDRVRGVAGDLGIDLDDVERRVDALDGEAVTGLAEQIRDARQEQPLAGGDTVVITSTTIIIVLLIIILIVAS